MAADPAQAVTAFVAGATGFTGNALVRTLRQRGVATRAHVRPDSSRLAEWSERFGALGATVDTTPWDEEKIRESLRTHRVTHVFALLGTTRKRAADPRNASRIADTYEAVDWGLTALLLRASVDAGVKRFIYLGSAGTTDSTTNPYLAVRARVERELRASPLSWAVARPSFITGDRDEDRPMERWGSRLADAALGVVGALGATTLRDRYRSTDATTLANALARIGLDHDDNRVWESEHLR